MGSCLVPLMTEFALNMVDQELADPKLFIRYVDDCLALFETENEAEMSLHNLNSLPSITTVHYGNGQRSGY